MSGRDRYPWTAMGVVLIGSFMVILDTTIVNVALPQIGIALGSESGIDWIVTSYLLAVGLIQPATGWMADRFGRKRVYIVSLSCFSVGSLLAAMAPNLEMLVAFRVVQGLGGGAVIPVGMAMIYELFPPHRRGTAMGIWGVATMAAPAFGPIIGGFLVTAVSWHWLFLVNVPIGVLGVSVAIKLLRDTGYREHRRLDITGLGFVSAGLVMWLYAFANAPSWGWGAPQTITLLVVGGGFLVTWVLWELRIHQPAIDVRMFQVPIFSLTVVIVGALVVAQYAVLVFAPLILQTVRDYTALQTGFMLLPIAVAGAITYPLGGRLTDRIGPRIPVTIGALFSASAAWMLGHLEADASILRIEIAMAVVGLGFGLGMMPCTVTGMNALPSRFVAQSAAVRQLNVRVATSFGVALLSTVVVMQLGAVSAASVPGISADTAQSAYNRVFLISCAIALGAAVLALFLPGRERTMQLVRDRTAEQHAALVDAA